MGLQILHLLAGRVILRLSVSAVIFAAVCGGICPQRSIAQETAPRFVQELSEGGRGQFYKCDLQHRFADSELTAAQFVARAVDHGCDIVIVTPPQPTDKPAVLRRFLDEVAAAQQAFPKTIVLPGYSWLVRTTGVSGRATILIPPGADFTSRFLELPKKFVKPGSDISTAEALSRTLRNLCPDAAPVESWPVIVFDQFRDGSTLHRWSVEHLGHGDLWRSTGQKPLPALGQFGLLDRWDQSDVRSGGEWDQLLADGWNAWAAAEDLDMVRETSARFKPGELTETFLRLTEFTAPHALHALRTGAFYGVRGRVVRDLEFSVLADGLPRPALAGETIDVPAGTVIRVKLSLTIPDVDWKQSPNRLDGIEFIAVTPEGSTILHKVEPQFGRVVIEQETEVPAGGVLFRALGYRVIKDGTDHSFYTNPIRVLAGGRWERPKVEPPRTSWLVEDAHLWVASLLGALSVIAVGGWLVATGKMSLLLGDVFSPVIRRWRSSKLHRWLLRTFPFLVQRTKAPAETLGTSLTQQESLGILATLIAGSAVLGGLTGFLAWPSQAIPFESLASRLTGALCGAAIGGAMGAAGRVHPFLGAWLWIVAQTLAGAFPDVGLERSLASLLAMALMSSVASEPLRTGLVRWPADVPAGGVLGVLGLLIATGLLATAAPPPWSSLAGLVGPVAAAAWILLNVREARAPLRLLAMSFLVMLWFGGRLSQQSSAGTVVVPLRVLQSLSEAVGVAALWLTISPKRWDGLNTFFILPAFGVVCLLFPAGPPLDRGSFLAGALMTALLLCAADTTLFANAGGGIAAVMLGITLLFSYHQPGAWLLAGLACLAAGLAHRSAVRMLLFLAPYLIVAGYRSIEATAPMLANSSPLASFFSLVRQESAGLQQHSMQPSEILPVAGQLLSLFSLAAFAAFARSVRDPNRADVFDAAGRMALAALLFCGAMLLMNIPAPGAMLLAISPLLGVWAAHLRSGPPGENRSADAVPLVDLLWRRWRTRLGIASGIVAGLLAYGSLVPFHWRDIVWTQAVREFLEQVRTQHVWTRISSDRLVNVLLTVPLAGCAYGSMVLGRRSILNRLWAVIEALQLSFVISVLVEMAQKWSAGRVASVDDVVAQTLGAAIGILAWVALGERLVSRWAASDRRQTQARRWEQLLAVYLLGVLLLSILPVRMPVTSPKQLYDRYREGQLSPMPFADGTTWDKVVRDAAVGVVLFIPAGLWAAIAFRKPDAPPRSFIAAAALGTAFAALITAVRALCSVEPTDSSWLLTGLVGSAIGAAAIQQQARRRFDEYANWKSGLGWGCLCLLFVGVVAANLLYPLTFDASPEIVAAKWQQFVNTPFASFHSGDDLNLIEEVLRKLAWFGALGLLLGQAVCRGTELRAGRIVGGILSLVLAIMLAGGIEFAQTHQTHHSAEITDVLIYAVGALLGLWIRFRWLTERMIDETPPMAGASLSGLASPSWVAVLQTTIAVGLLLGLLSGLALLFLRR